MIAHETLHELTVDAVKEEKAATLKLLQFLSQVEDRRTYAVLGFDSLFKYVEVGLSYSPSQASERISAMRLLRKVPEVAQRLTDGEHSLTTLLRVATHVKRENLNSFEASELVRETANQSVVQVEKLLAGIALVEPPKMERVKVISKHLTRLMLDVDEEFMATLQRLREIQGNPALSLGDAFQMAMEEYIQNRDLKTKARSPKRPACSTQNKEQDLDKNSQILRTAELNGSSKNREGHSTEKRDPKSNRTAIAVHSRYLPTQDRRIARERAENRCEYVHLPSGRRCSSRFALQFDHHLPFAKGGESREWNLRMLCPAHNRLRAIQEFGERKMRPYLKR